jgi:methylase of polypeptide subunit release factors
LEFSRANAALNGIAADTLHSNLLSKVHGLPDLIISNPPYLADSKHRIYRDGGGQWGFDLSLRIVTESLERLHPDGLFLLYTGTPIVTGTDKFLAAVQGVLRKKTTAYQYDEIDPDVFGEELEGAPYNTADRIAAVLLLVDGKNIRR